MDQKKKQLRTEKKFLLCQGDLEAVKVSNKEESLGLKTELNNAREQTNILQQEEHKEDLLQQ